MDKSKISILGTDYEYRVGTVNEDPELEGIGGYCEPYKKIISVNFAEYINDKYDDSRIPRIKEVKRHEIIHAFVRESGVYDKFDEELIAAWLSTQFTKMLEVFQQIDAI